MPKKKKSIADTIADAVEMEIESMATVEVPSETGRGFDDELDFDNQDFSLIEDNED